MSEKSPSERLANICAALEEDLNDSPFTREEWELLDAERLELLKANDALAARLAEAERLLRWADSMVHEFPETYLIEVEKFLRPSVSADEVQK